MYIDSHAKQEKFVLSLESILLYLTQGDIEEANLAAMRYSLCSAVYINCLAI